MASSNRIRADRLVVLALVGTAVAAALVSSGPPRRPPRVRLADVVEGPHRSQILRAGEEWRRGLTTDVQGEVVLQTHYEVPSEARDEIRLPASVVGASPRVVEVLTADGFDRPRLRRTLEVAAGASAPVATLDFASDEVGQRHRLLARWREDLGRDAPIRTRPVEIASGTVLRVGLAQSAVGEAEFRIAFEPTDGGATGGAADLLRLRDRFGPEAWRDVEVSLEPLAGRRGRFVLRHQSDAGAPLWGDPALEAARAPSLADPAAGRPSFLLVSLDTLRADRMSVFGYGRETTPRLAERRREAGGFYARGVAPASSTAPSHMTLFTSTLPCVHGVLGLFAEESLPHPLRTLPEILAERGYATSAVTENGYMGHSFGFTRGFDRFREVRREESAEDPVVETTFSVAAEALRAVARHPPFLFLAHTYAVHAPYLPPAEAVRALGVGESDSERYDAEVWHLDRLLDELLSDAEAAGLLENTYVVLFSDHGEEFGEHGRIGHGFQLFEESVRVPLIVLGPGLPAVASDEAWGLIDVAPTLLDLARAPAWRQARGRSFAPSLAGRGEARAQPVFGETAHQNQRMALEGRWKVVHDAEGPATHVFDLDADPGEAAADDSEEGRAAAKRLLAAYRAACVEARSALGVTPDRSKASSAQWESWDRSRIEKLRALGYVDDGDAQSGSAAQGS